ncbi:hypothetical protein MC885_020865 [Smutsia gigantea]|nr:hypothetical protein MC885_020865 [Smutsia gigantea]
MVFWMGDGSAGLLTLHPVLVQDGKDTDHTVGAVELLLPWVCLGRLHLLVIHEPAELDVRVFWAHVHYHARDLGLSGDHEDILGFRGEDEDGWSSQDIWNWSGDRLHVGRLSPVLSTLVLLAGWCTLQVKVSLDHLLEGTVTMLLTE